HRRHGTGVRQLGDQAGPDRRAGGPDGGGCRPGHRHPERGVPDVMVRVISGGQTGSDQGGLRAARDSNIETGGWAAKGWLCEDGPHPELAEFGLKECQEGGTPAERYRARRRANAREADAVLIFGDMESPGSRGLIKDCREFGVPWMAVHPGVTTVREVVAWLRSIDPRTL